VNINKFLDTKGGLAITVGLLYVAGVYIAEQKARNVATEIGDAISPINNNNIFANGVDAIGAKLSGKENFKLGVWIYDVFN